MSEGLAPPMKEDPLRLILAGTAREIGEGFFKSLVENLSRALGTHGAWVTEYLPDQRRLRALAFRLGSEWVEGFEQPIDGSPCEAVIENRKLLHLPERVFELYPDRPGLRRIGAVSYMGFPLLDLDGTVLGHLAVIDQRPMPPRAESETIFEIFAGRAAAELRRLRAERQIREREQQLTGLVESAMDAIVQLDQQLRVVRLNPAAERTFGLAPAVALGQDVSVLLAQDDAARFAAVTREISRVDASERSRWLALTGKAEDGQTFPAEATVSCNEVQGRLVYTLILRNVNDRIEAEQRIRSLTDEAEYLRAELHELGRSGEIIGRSESLLQVLHEVRQVAPADTTVLIHGETGTGKELFVRALHQASARKDKPLVKVNCAAIPGTLIESEFFGHERGAFTGATGKRDGRFTLADGGSIFLDEIGELPLELQGKLLRVLQEGEFEPVGSSRTRKVDVRVVAATNRDLLALVGEGKFREDLYYRLSVFPVHLPPLRERGDDVVVLAGEFAQQFARRLGRRIEPISPSLAARLKQYGWPGNVRELQNVIERAVITAQAGTLNLDRALPSPKLGESPSSDPGPDSPAILTAGELEHLERRNIERALEKCGGQVAGESGAARLLGIAPSTLASRMKALGLRKPG